MVVSLEKLLERSTDRMGDGMNPVVKESALEVIKRAYAEGIYVQLSAGYRSIVEQNALYIQGRRGIKGEKIVTNAKGGQSMHNYGLAVDFFLLNDNGQAIWTVNNQWKRVAAIAKELGFEWGGDWKNFYDAPHIEMNGGLTIAQLQAGKRPTLTLKFDSSIKIAEVKKEEDEMSNVFVAPNEAVRNMVRSVLYGWEQEEKDPLSDLWRYRFDKGELTESEAIGVIFTAIGRGFKPFNN